MRKLALSLFVIALVGCSGNDGTSDLRVYVNEVLAKPRGIIEPLPVFDPYEAFTYSATGLRSPFDVPIDLSEIAEQVEPDQDVQPDFNRIREHLEQYSISELSMVGTIEKSDRQLWALISAPGSSSADIHKVKQGYYIGQNHGRIVSVSQQRLDIIEIVPNGTGGWIERPRTLVLDGAEEE